MISPNIRYHLISTTILLLATGFIDIISYHIIKSKKQNSEIPISPDIKYHLISEIPGVIPP